MGVRSSLSGVALVLLSVVFYGTLRGQESYTELNVHGSTLVSDLFEESSNALQVGTRILHRTNSGLSFGGNFDFATVGDVSVRSDLEPVSATILLYSFEIDYTARVSPRTEVFFGSGIGAATVRFDDVGDGRLTESSTGQLVPVAGGLKFLSRAESPGWAFRVEARDNIILRTIVDPTTLEENDEIRHNWELSAGLSFLFGARSPAATTPDGAAQPPVRPRPQPVQPAAEPEPVDEGVDEEPSAQAPDPADEAVDPAPDPVVEEPPFEPVPEEPVVEEPRFEPLPEDPVVEEPPADPVPGPIADLDVDEGQPDLEPPPAGACATGHVWFTRGDAIPFDGRFFVPVGEPEPISLDNLVEVGEHDGVRIYVAALAEEPYVDLWLPACTGGLFHLYVEPDGQ